MTIRRESFLSKVSDQIEGRAKLDNILIKEQSQIVHVGHSIDVDEGSGSSEEHAAGGEEHQHANNAADDAGFGFEEADYDEHAAYPLGKSYQVSPDIRAKQFIVPADKGAVGDQRYNAFGAWRRHFKGACPEEHQDHANGYNEERNITIDYPCGETGQRS